MAIETLIEKVQKRDGSIAPFDANRITLAMFKAMVASAEKPHRKTPVSETIAPKAVEIINNELKTIKSALRKEQRQKRYQRLYKEAENISNKVVDKLNQIRLHHKTFVPTVEGIQDMVENELIHAQFSKAAKAYILYREKRAEFRRRKIPVPEHVKKLAEQSKQYFRNALSEFVYLRTYARWIEKEQRRETWIETIDRYLDFMRENLGEKLANRDYNELREAMLNQEVMPSMRLMQFAGPAARATNVCAYNCSYIAPSSLQDFGEVMYISMCGTGVGFSVESANIQTLPIIKRQTGEALPTHVIPDSKEGWCNVLVLGMKTWFNGKDIKFDYSKLRPAGARLKTMGGKSSGPEPLRSLLDFTRERILRRQGRRLSNLDAHDILCKIGEVVVSGGVRRSAMISLSDLDDADLRNAKQGPFYYTDPQRSMANNSTVYVTKPTNREFMDEWIALMKSGSGERGIFNRSGLAKTLPPRRIKFLKDQDYIHGETVTGIIGCNPCGEIILRSKSFCNLTEIVARAEDNEESLLRKVRLATILGTYQATLTKFPYLSKEWQDNCYEERLLGVSITGQWDCKAVRNSKMLEKLKQRSITVNRAYAKRFEINPAVAITCIKPSGTVSQVVDCASGMHQRYAPYYIRRIRISASDSLFKMLKDQGVPYYPEVGQTEESATTFVLEFPVKAPRGAIYRNELNAIQQLEYWKIVKSNFTEHNPSVTILVNEHEWISVANWVYENWNIVGGLSFLPRSDHVYRLAPFEEIDEARFNELTQKLKNIDYSQIVTYERTDETEVKRELACVGGACEIE